MLDDQQSYARLAPWVERANPLVPFGASIALWALALRTRRSKWIWLAPLLCCYYLAFTGAAYWPSSVGLDSFWGLLISIWASHSLSVLFLEDPTFLVYGKGVFEQQTWGWRFWSVWNNPRLLGTSRAAESHPPSSSSAPPSSPAAAVASLKQHLSSRTGFAVRCVVQMLISWSVTTYVQPRLLPGQFVPLCVQDFDATRQTFIRRLPATFWNQQRQPQQPIITVRELGLRVVMAFFWALPPYLTLNAAYYALAFIFVVLLRADRPHQWPPLYGDLRKAHSLRGFWGRFWHRLVVIPYGNVGKLLAERCLSLGPTTVTPAAGSTSVYYKAVVACSVFVLSGVVHAAVAWQLGDRCCWHLDIAWFFLNFVACTVESVCFPAPRKAGGGPPDRAPQCPERFLGKGLGFAWTFFFFFWSVPKWQYPKLHAAFLELSTAEMNPQD